MIRVLLVAFLAFTLSASANQTLSTLQQVRDACEQRQGGLAFDCSGTVLIPPTYPRSPFYVAHEANVHCFYDIRTNKMSVIAEGDLVRLTGRIDPNENGCASNPNCFEITVASSGRMPGPFFASRPFAPLPGHRFATRYRSGDTHGRCPASPLLRPHPTTALAYATGSSPKFPCRTFEARRPRSPNRIGHEVLTSHMETCWSRGFRVNETLRRKFTCVAAYFFVRQDSRTSVALCTACPPNRMSISLRFSSFQLIVYAELCLAYLCQ